MGFSCTHCGRCCSDTIIQINLTLGDIVRLGAYLGKPYKWFFDQGILGLKPFFNPDTLKYDIELGLSKPCKFHQHGRCSVYPARPLNCRLFPEWVLASNDSQIIGKFKQDGFECFVELNKSELQATRVYVKAVGEILLRESRITDKLVQTLKDSSGLPEGLVLGVPKIQFNLERERVALAQAIINKMDTKKLKAGLLSYLKQNKQKWATIEELNKLDRG
ncbi:YkgJ family cysteine cluster protein [Candidatus Woesearchaeota archaeon]|nr:YkgJ family cysteine cluster protein [Candidatus Woesearchaeota archaeon]